MIKKNIFFLFLALCLIVVLTGCGSSGQEIGLLAPKPKMIEVRLSLSTNNGEAVTEADVALYTPAAAVEAGLNKISSLSSQRASISNQSLNGVFKPSGKDDNGNLVFNVLSGEYTLVAERAGNKAVLAAVRLAGNTTRLSATLVPTGAIRGRVLRNNEPVAAAMVYIEKTSFVAFTKTDGTFEITGVPTESRYDLLAIATIDGKKYAAESKVVNISSRALVFEANDIPLFQLTQASKKIIKGKFVDSSGAPIANKIAIAVCDDICTLSVSDSQGVFSIPVESNGNYRVTSIEPSNPEYIPVTVDSTKNTFDLSSNLKLIANSSACVTGKIKIDPSYRGLIDGTMPDVGNFLVRLIGSDTTDYAVSFWVDYNKNLDSASNVGWNFTFDNIPAGKYSVLVDPAGNGFFGSAGNINVAFGEKEDVGEISVINLIPYYEVQFLPDLKLKVTETLPFMQTNGTTVESLLAFVYEVNGGSTVNLGAPSLISLPAGPSVALYEVTYSISPSLKNGYVKVVLANSWSCPYTGLNGAVYCREPVMVKYVNSTNFIGEWPIELIKSSGLTTETLGSVKLNSDGSVSAVTTSSSLGCKFYFRPESSASFDVPINVPGYLLDYSKKNVIYKSFDDPKIVCLSKDGGASYAYSKVLGAEPDEGFVSCEDPNKAAFLYTSTEGKVVELCDLALGTSFIFPDKPKTKACNFVLYAGSLYMSLLGKDGNDYEIAIYRVREDFSGVDEVVTHNFSYDGHLGKISNFSCLFEKFFYLKILDRNNTIQLNCIINKDTSLQEQLLTNRFDSLVDKYGYIYQYDDVAKSLIKVASIDAKPLESFKIPGEYKGILGFDKNDKLYLWVE